MTHSFHPPGIESLAEVDKSNASYSGKRVVIRGVVSPASQGGWAGNNDGCVVHCFSFAAWRRIGEPIVKRTLTILRPVPPDWNFWHDFPAYSIQQIRVLLSSDETRAIFAESLPVDAPDPQLQGITKELQRPVIVETSLFGELVLDRSIGFFHGCASWSGNSINIHFPVEEDQIDDIALNTAEKLWSDQAEWNMRIEERAVEDLLDIRNNNWRQDSEPELTAMQFLARMSLSSVSISSNGEFEFWYDDGELFWDHAIMVSGDLKNGPTDASIQG